MMMAMGTTTGTPLLTFEEFERLEEHPGKQELLKGVLIGMLPTGSKQNRDATRIFRTLDATLWQAHERGEAGDLGEVFIEMGYRIGEQSWLQPDVSISHPRQPEGEYIEGSPAIAIEVVAPDQRAEALQWKTAVYFEHGAREVWHLYPKTRRMVISAGSASKVRVESEFVTTPLLPGLALKLKDILGE
jgi:Uma2 family endonuclease